ncbi:MAG: polysaccharide deacetylase family protein [Bacteroidetes bacterium]|nr:polysaccharide deacetylase family protein [Bacteroidota bacterium]
MQAITSVLIDFYKNIIRGGYFTWKRLPLAMAFLCLFVHNSTAQSYSLPKALFLTTGDGEGNGTVSDGIVLALQSFNKLGVPVRLENRDILLIPNQLDLYSILIIPTRIGYHDQPYPYSLTYMSVLEMSNISNWVKKGGTLVTGINIGRNSLESIDRLSNNESLNSTNYTLSTCLGLELIEKEMSNYWYSDNNLGIWDEALKRINIPRWNIVPSNTSKSVKINSWWKNGVDSFPAITTNKHGNGNAICLPTFDFIHPVEDNGLSTQKEIDLFYEFVYNTAIGSRKNEIYLHPWINAMSSAFCWTFDDGGSLSEYQRIIRFIDQTENKTIFFVTPEIDSSIILLLRNNPNIKLEGHSYSHSDFRELSFFETKNEFLMNRDFWGESFSGFRFPYVSNSFWGMYLLEEMNFTYETSIAANHFDFIRGSVVPYNIPIFNQDFYKSLDLLEISQIYRSDWYFYQKILNEEEYRVIDQEADAHLFEHYLKTYLDSIVIPNNGAMVFLGHPMYSGISETTIKPLYKLQDYIKSKNVWVTSPNEIAQRWNKLRKLDIAIQDKDDAMCIELCLPNDKLEGLSFRLEKTPVKVKCNQKHKLKIVDEATYLIIDLDGSAKVTLTY